MKPLSRAHKRYSQILIASLMSGGSLLPLLPVLADPLLSTAPQNSAAPGKIENQATAEFTDSADNSVGQIVSDIVSVQVAEIAGISATGVGINSAVVGTAPTLYPTSTAYFDFIVKNEGNDPTKLFIPAAPSVATVNGVAVTAGQLQIISYSAVAPVTNAVTTTPASTLVDQTTGTATDSVTPGSYVTVRVPITIPFGTPHDAPIVVTLGNTPTAPVVGTPVNNMPYVASGIATGTNDLLTQDNPVVNATTGEVNATAPFNGEREASATQTAKVIVPKIVISGKVYDDGNNSANNTFTNQINDGTESGAIVTPPIYAILVNSSNQVVASTQVINSGTGTTTVNGTNGTYTFNDVDGYQNGLYVILSSTSLSAGSPVTAASQTLPTGWVATSPLIYPAFNVTNGDTPALIASYTGKDFGIEQLPTAVGFTVASQVNPVGVNQFTVPPTVFTSSTDPDGTVAAYKITAFPTNAVTITINGTPYTSANFPAGGVTVTLAQLQNGNVTVDPIDGASTVNIPFQAIDNAGKLSLNTATGSLPFSAANVTISGTIYHDKDKSAITTPASGSTPTLFTNIKPNTTTNVDDSPTDTKFGTNGAPIYATLVDASGNILASQIIGSNGLYSFAGVTATTNVKVILSATVPGAPGTPAPTPGLTVGWVGTTAQDSGTFNTGNYGTNVAIGGFAPKDFGVIQKAKLVIVKRITKIGKTVGTMSATNPNDGTSLTAITSDTFNFNPTNNPTAPAGYIGNWPTNYIVGAVDAGRVVPGDFIEYTIYFLNNQGADAKNVKICDPIRGNQDYAPGSTTLNLTTDPMAAGTAISDVAPRLDLFSDTNIPANCNAATSIGTNTSGVSLDITTIGTETATADQPVGIPGATGVGTANTYGMFRFRTQVKP